jgi:hypothetical protein
MIGPSGRGRNSPWLDGVGFPPHRWVCPDLVDAKKETTVSESPPPSRLRPAQLGWWASAGCPHVADARPYLRACRVAPARVAHAEQKVTNDTVHPIDPDHLGSLATITTKPAKPSRTTLRWESGPASPMRRPQPPGRSCVSCSRLPRRAASSFVEGEHRGQEAPQRPQGGPYSRSGADDGPRWE